MKKVEVVRTYSTDCAKLVDLIKQGYVIISATNTGAGRSFYGYVEYVLIKETTCSYT